MYDYHSKIHYEIENNFVVKEISETKKRVRRLNEIRNFCAQRLEHTVVQQTKYYNQKHKPIFYSIGDLIILFTKNLKQKRFSKKLFHKFVDPFKVKNKIKSQTYCLTLFNTYRIHNIFYMFLLKRYYYRTNDAKTKSMLQVSKLIDNDEQ